MIQDALEEMSFDLMASELKSGRPLKNSNRSASVKNRVLSLGTKIFGKADETKNAFSYFVIFELF